MGHSSLNTDGVSKSYILEFDHQVEFDTTR